VDIDHDSATPLYVQLAALIRGQIEDGTLTGRIPSVKTLSQEHGVSHVTAEKALAVLKDDGVIHSVIGKGTFVKPAPS
jgi:DNA-binding GntR family transcriptional regulator